MQVRFIQPSLAAVDEVDADCLVLTFFADEEEGLTKLRAGFTPDIGDTIPGGFGKAEWTALVNFVNDKDLDAELDAAAKVQAEATQ